MRKILQFILILLLSCQVAWAGVDCDGTDDFGDASAVTNIPLHGDITVFAVFVPDGTGTGHKVVAKWASALDWLLDTSGSAGKIRWIQTQSDTTNAPLQSLTSSNSYSAGEVVRVAATSSGGLFMAMNMNGTEVTGNTSLGNFGVSGSAPLSFCAGGSGARATYFDGKIYEVAIWDTQLTATQRETLVNSRVKGLARQMSPANLVWYTSIDETPHGTTMHAATSRDFQQDKTITWDDGANNTGMTATAGNALTYP